MLLFVYKTLKDTSLSEKVIGHAINVISENAELKDYEVINEGDDYHTIIPKIGSVVIGSIIEVNEFDLQKLDEYEKEYRRQEVTIGELTVYVYIMKPEYLREKIHKQEEFDKRKKDEFLALALERFESCKQNCDHQKIEYDDDIKYKYGEQWRLDVAQDRQNDNRPMLTINQTDNFINNVVNEGLQNRPQIKVRPNDDHADTLTADVIAGMMRHIITKPESKIATDCAYENAVSGGMGFLRVLTDYCDNQSFDQEIQLSRIENSCTVSFPDHLIKKQDYSDAPYAFIRQKYSRKEFEEKWPAAEVTAAAFSTAGVGDSTWIEKDSCYVAEYFVIDEIESKIYLLPPDARHETSYMSNEVPPGVIPLRERSINKKVCKWNLITKWDILESKTFPASRIPIIPIFGKEIFFNGKKHFISLVRHMREPQRMLNYLWTAFIEAVQNSPRAPYIAEESQIKPFKKFWDTLNTKNWPYLPYKAKTVGGTVLPPPQRVEPPEAGRSVIEGIRFCMEFMKDTTGIQNANLGITSNERTGAAIEARKRQGNLATYHFMNNYCNAMLSLGELLLEMIPVVYDTPRAVRIIGEDMAEKVVLVNQMHKDAEDPKRLYDLKTGRYSVIITIGPSYDSRRVETADMLSKLMQTAPNLTMIFFDILARVMDMPGALEIAARAKRFINQQYPGIIEDENLGTPEEQLRDQIQQMTIDFQKLLQKSQLDEVQKAQMQQMIKILDTALKSKDDEIQSKVHIAELRASTEIAKANMDLMREKISHEHDSNKHAIDSAIKIHQSAGAEKNNTGKSGNIAEP